MKTFKEFIELEEAVISPIDTAKMISSIEIAYDKVKRKHGFLSSGSKHWNFSYGESNKLGELQFPDITEYQIPFKATAYKDDEGDRLQTPFKGKFAIVVTIGASDNLERSWGKKTEGNFGRMSQRQMQEVISSATYSVDFDVIPNNTDTEMMFSFFFGGATRLNIQEQMLAYVLRSLSLFLKEYKKIMKPRIAKLNKDFGDSDFEVKYKNPEFSGAGMTHSRTRLYKLAWIKLDRKIREINRSDGRVKGVKIIKKYNIDIHPERTKTIILTRK